MSENETINIRIKAGPKRELEAAAQARRMSLSAFMLFAAFGQANQDKRDSERRRIPRR